ncbi:MAG: multicopper oxidase family protein [Hamadaea sp.]|nr:multicopper oxidase family protein [Hamadaea sp.]
MRVPRRIRLTVAVVAAVAVLAPLVWLWWDSRLSSAYSVMDMGVIDAGGRPPHGHAPHGAGRSVTSLIADPDRPADVSVTLVARKQRAGRAAYTINGSSPGPVVRAVQGQLVQVRLENESVPAGVTLHWHGVDVPGAEDGVAGVTQDAVPVGGEHVYRFVADQAGTFWYHSHQISHEQVEKGLFGALVITPRGSPPGPDVVAVSHVFGGVRTVNGVAGDLHVGAQPGQHVRVRVVNTDNGLTAAWVGGSPFRLLAIDGTDLTGPTQVRDAAVLVTAGGRVDLEIVVPSTPTRVHLGGPTGVVLGDGTPTPVARPAAVLDPLTYGTPAALPFDPQAADRVFRYEIGRRPGFIDGKPGLFWTINGRLYPDIPMFTVAVGDIVRMTIVNRSGEAHPMHLHGHHAVVLARDGVPATGAPWWVDSLEVDNGQTVEVAFAADNPGIWADHCHNLPHAAEGLVAHLMYEGVTTPFTIGGGNHPE